MQATGGALYNLFQNPLNRDAFYRAELEWKLKKNAEQRELSALDQQEIDDTTMRGVKTFQKSVSFANELFQHFRGDQLSVKRLTRPDNRDVKETITDQTMCGPVFDASSDFLRNMQKPVSTLWTDSAR